MIKVLLLWTLALVSLWKECDAASSCVRTRRSLNERHFEHCIAPNVAAQECRECAFTSSQDCINKYPRFSCVNDCNDVYDEYVGNGRYDQPLCMISPDRSDQGGRGYQGGQGGQGGRGGRGNQGGQDDQDDQGDQGGQAYRSRQGDQGYRSGQDDQPDYLQRDTADEGDGREPDRGDSGRREPEPYEPEQESGPLTFRPQSRDSRPTRKMRGR